MLNALTILAIGYATYALMLFVAEIVTGEYHPSKENYDFIGPYPS